MADDITAILTPEGLPLSDPGQVERALAALWKPPPDEADAEVATRVCVGNLLVVGLAADWNQFIDVLGSLSPRYPSRTIALLLADPGATRGRAGDGFSPCVMCLSSAGLRCVANRSSCATGPCESEDLHRDPLAALGSGCAHDVAGGRRTPTSAAAWRPWSGRCSDRLVLDAGLVRAASS